MTTYMTVFYTKYEEATTLARLRRMVNVKKAEIASQELITNVA